MHASSAPGFHCAEITVRFEINDVNGRLASKLTDDELELLGVRHRIRRRRVLNELQQLFQQDTPTEDLMPCSSRRHVADEASGYMDVRQPSCVVTRSKGTRPQSARISARQQRYGCTDYMGVADPPSSLQSLRTTCPATHGTAKSLPQAVRSSSACDSGSATAAWGAMAAEGAAFFEAAAHEAPVVSRTCSNGVRRPYQLHLMQQERTLSREGVDFLKGSPDYLKWLALNSKNYRLLRRMPSPHRGWSFSDF